jgi:exodeoxyribonuclease-5
MSEISLTKSQEEAMEKIHKFLNSDQRFFRLTGPPGSGKTFVIKHALSSYLKKEEDTNTMIVVGITLSHKAKGVLHRASIKNCRTFASAYGYKEIINEDGSRDFATAKSYEELPVGHLEIPIFVHDEISQYSYKMKNIVFEKTSIFSKVIIMGDMAQLPPIDASMQPDEDSPMFFFELADFCQHELKERVRQKVGNPILDLSDIIREEIFGKQDLGRVIREILKPKLDDEGKGYLCLPKNDLYREYLKSDNFLHNKMIAFRKFKVEEMNIKARSLIHPNASSSLITTDLISMTNNFRSENPPFKLMNSDEFIIQGVRKEKVMMIHSEKLIECYFGEIDNQGYKAHVVTPTEIGLETYKNNLNRLISNAKQNTSLWKHKFEFTDSFCDFTMGYGINAYKCQGSTYKNVFIDLIDILETGPLTPKRKLQTIFTAMTRATDIAHFIKP